MNKIIKAFFNPGFALKRVYEKFYISPVYSFRHKKTHEKLLNHFGYELIDYHKIIDETKNDKVFQTSVNQSLAECNLRPSFPLDPLGWPATIYYFIRKTKPSMIVETGVWYGFSTSMILLALQKNNYGRLVSIDLPAYFETGGYRDENPYLSEDKRRVSLPEGKNPGFIVPEYLKQRWKMVLGDAKIELPKVFIDVKDIDIFLHDSLHSYQNMTLEFETALKKLNKY